MRNKYCKSRLMDWRRRRRIHGSNLESALSTIAIALDCQSHFHKPTIVWNDKDFTPIGSPILICGECVKRMKSVLDSNKFPYYK